MKVTTPDVMFAPVAAVTTRAKQLRLPVRVVDVFPRSLPTRAQQRVHSRGLQLHPCQFQYDPPANDHAFTAARNPEVAVVHASAADCHPRVRSLRHHGGHPHGRTEAEVWPPRLNDSAARGAPGMGVRFTALRQLADLVGNCN